MASEKRCFTFVWKLENISYSIRKQREAILSPVFMVDAIEGTKWRLQLYPRGGTNGKNIVYYLRRDKDSGGRGNVEIEYELNFIGKNESVLETYVAEKVFSKGAAFGFRNVSIQDVFVARKSIFLPNDIMTLRCRIWKNVGEMRENVKCTALTRIGVEKRTYKWEVKNFSSLDLEEELNHEIKSIQNDLLLMSVDISLTGGLNSEIIRFELSLLDESIKFASLQLYLIDSSGNRVDCNKEEMWFDHPNVSKELIFVLTKKNLLERKEVYLPNDTLTLIWEWGFSRGVISEEYLNRCSDVKVSDEENSSDYQKTLCNHLMDNLKCSYDEQFLSDVKLKTATREFPAHKLILSVSSSVFKTMFSCDMKQKINDCVYIGDLDDDTVNRMLLFIYTTRVENLTLESASNLYAAADKYAISSLKNVCSSFLKKHLSASNACDVLLLADSRADDDLKSYVQDYIVENGRKITKSEEWKALMKAKGTLAAETLCQLFR